MDVCADWHLSDRFEKLYPIPSRQICHRADLPLAPKSCIWKGRDITHMDPATHHCTAFAQTVQGLRDQIAHGCKNYGAVQHIR